MKRDREDGDTEDEQPKKVMAGNFEVTKDEDCDDEMIGDLGKGEYYDDRTGDVLDSNLVMKAEAEELEYMRHLGVADEVEEQECWDMTGRTPRMVCTCE